MRTIIQATGIEHTNAIDAYIGKKLRDLEKLLDPKEESAIVEVEVGKPSRHHKSGRVFYAEITLRLKGRKFRATSSADDLYAAIDEVKDEILGEVAHYRDKKRAELKAGGREVKKRLRGE
jgi:ribosomal subunit interface protein